MNYESKDFLIEKGIIGQRAEEVFLKGGYDFKLSELLEEYHKAKVKNSA